MAQNTISVTLDVMLLILSAPLPYVATTAGWMTAEIGRQPWLVYGLMRTAEGASPHISSGNVLFTLLGFAVFALVALFIYRHKNNGLCAFASSAALIIILMLSVGFTIYPNLLIATTDPANSLTIYTTATSEYALRLGLIWFSVGITLATGYTLFMYRSFRGKVKLPEKGEGY